MRPAEHPWLAMQTLTQTRVACSLARALDRAQATVPAVAEALSNTAAGFPLGLPSLTKLLCNSSKRGKHAKALAVFAAAPDLGLAPDLPLCNAALMAASSAGNAVASAMIFRQMVSQGLQPDSVSYRASVTALVKYDHLKEALQVWPGLRTLHSPDAAV